MRVFSLSLVACAFLVVLACRTPQSEDKSASAAVTMPAKDSVDVVQKQVDAYNAQDLESFLATYSEDAVITSASTGQVVLQGKDKMRERYGDVFRKYPNNRVRIAERRTEGDKIVMDHEIITGRSPDRPDPWDVGWVRYEVEGGLIRKVQLP